MQANEEAVRGVILLSLQWTELGKLVNISIYFGYTEINIILLLMNPQIASLSPTHHQSPSSYLSSTAGCDSPVGA